MGFFRRRCSDDWYNKTCCRNVGWYSVCRIAQKGKNVEKESQAGVVESTKAASDVYTPITGEITETNQLIVDDPGAINKDPEGSAWFFRVKIKNKSELDELMSKADYDKFVKENPN